MSVRVYGRPFNRTHENEMLHRFLESVKQEWEQSDEPLIVLANVSWNDRAIDTAVLKPHAIVIVDFKDYGGKIELSENGAWFAVAADKRIPVKGGGDAGNPYTQVRNYKNAVTAWFNEHGGRLPSGNRPNPGHTNGLIIFQQPCTFDARADLAPNILSWFRVCSFADSVRQLAEFASPSINLSNEDLQAIVAKLGVHPYEVPGPSQSAPVPQEEDVDVDVPSSLRNAADAASTFLESGDRILLISGMIGTGIDRLLPLITKRIRRLGGTALVNVRNSRLARRHSDLGAQSIYQHIYEPSAKLQGDVLVRELCINHDSSTQIYVLIDGHTVSDGIQRTGITRYGTGNLLRDYLEFIDLKGSNRKLIVVGDPFQMSAGGSNDSIMRKTLLEGVCGLPVMEIAVPELLPEATEDPLIGLATAPARALEKNLYNNLGLECREPSSAEIPTADLDRTVAEIFQENPRFAKYVAYTNEDVSRVNAFVRERLFHRGALLEVGDIIHVRTGPPMSDGIGRQVISHNSFAEVTAVDHSVVPITQPLSGRTNPVTIEFVRVSARPLSSDREFTFLCFRRYLYGAKPEEPTTDEMVALFVNAAKRWKERERDRKLGDRESADEETEDLGKARFFQGDLYLNAARVRFGYALTVSEAQGHRFPTVIANVDRTGHASVAECASESYFRFLYTVMTLAEDRLMLCGVLRLNPFIEARWADLAGGDGAIQTDWRFSVEAARIRLTGQTAVRSSLRDALMERLSPKQIAVVAVRSAQFQEQYYLSLGEHGLLLSAYYNKEGLFTRFSPLKATGAEVVQAVRGALTGA